MKEQVATAVMGQHDCCGAWRASRWSAAALILCCFMLMPWQGALAESNSASVPCPGKPNCVMLVVDGTVQSVPPIFRAAVTNTSINEIVLAGPRYVLRPTSWTVYSQQQPYRLTRNLTVRGLQGWSVMDFSLIEKKVLIASGVTVKFHNLVLANIRKLGGFGLDFFMGEAGSAMVLMDSIRVKPACQLPTDVFRSAQSFQRISPAFPNNEVKLLPKFCFTAALSSPEPQQQCFMDALQMTHFSLMAVYNDPDKGSQFPGYTLYHENVTRVCQSTITKKCLEDTNGDEELCMAMLVAASGIAGQPSRQTEPQGGGYHWSPGAAAGVAIAGGMFVLILFLMYILRRKLFRSCLHKQQHKKLVDPEAGLNRFDDPTHVNLNHSFIPSYTGGRAISQQVTLTTLLGAGSFGRVYRGRWHSSDVAIKIIVVRTPEELPKVLKEAEVMLQLDHPNIVRAFHASVWNPLEQVKATREARNSSSSSSAKTASAGAAVDVPTAAAAAAGAALDTSVARGRKNAVRRNSSSLRPAGAAGVGPVSPSAPAAASVAVPAATASGNHVATPSVSSEQRQPQTQNLTSSTHINTDSSQVAGRTGQLASSGHLAAAAANVVAAGPSTGANGLTGWLQIIPSQQQQQQPRGCIAHASSASADCASTMYADVGGRSGQQGTDGTSLVGPASPGRDAAQLQQLARSATDGVLDTSGQPFAAQGKRMQQPSQHSVCSLQQPSVPAQQQQQAGGLRRHLLSGWRNRPPKGSTASPGNSSSTLASPRAAAAAAAVAAAAPAGSGSGPRSSSQDGCTSGPHSGASAAGLMSSGGAVAIMHTPEVANGSTHGSRRSGAASQPSWAGSGSESGHAREEEAKKAQCEQQVWIILELCTGGTLLDAALSGRFKLAGSDQQQQQPPPGTRLEMAKLLSRLLDAANGMAYLHARGIMHGDLKAGNVLLQHSIHGSYGQIAKISDFGLSAVLLNGTTHRSTASLGTITHMAPELLRNGRMSPSADVYSFGILMWEVFCGKQAWQGLHYGVVVERVVISKERPPVPPDMPEDLELLMRRCWDDDPIKRPSFEQIVECLELLLDNLGSEDGEAGSIAFGQDVSVRVRGVSAPAAPPDHLRVQQQQDLEHAAGLQQDLQQYQRLSAPAAFAAAAVPAAFAGGAQPMQAVAAAQPPAGVPAGAAAAAAAQARPAAAAVVGLPLSAHTSPSTPVHPVQVPKQQSGLYDSGLAGDTGTHGSQAHSSSSQLRSSLSANPHSSHTANQPGGTSGRRPSVLDENVYLQDL